MISPSTKRERMKAFAAKQKAIINNKGPAGPVYAWEAPRRSRVVQRHAGKVDECGTQTTPCSKGKSIPAPRVDHGVDSDRFVDHFPPALSMALTWVCAWSMGNSTRRVCEKAVIETLPYFDLNNVLCGGPRAPTCMYDGRPA